jgi:hypothetical protein
MSKNLHTHRILTGFPTFPPDAFDKDAPVCLELKSIYNLPVKILPFTYTYIPFRVVFFFHARDKTFCQNQQ